MGSTHLGHREREGAESKADKGKEGLILCGCMNL